MPARLHFSNSLDALADRLLVNLHAEEGDPFVSPAIATPASAMRDWLKVRLAEKTGIAANIAFPHLENLLWDRLAERDRFRDAEDRLPARLLDPFSFQGLVLSRLRHEPPAALRDYLGSPLAEDRARRLCQLAGRLASLYREYEYNRVAEYGYRGLIASWMDGEPGFERHLLRGPVTHSARAHLAEVRALEAWQMEVYRSLFREEGLRDRWGTATGTYRYTLPQYAGLALRDPVTPGDSGGSPVFHLFGLSNISPFHRDLIGRLADAERLGEGAVRFEIYALNPCAEFWEDAFTLRERRARGPRILAPAPVPRERVEATHPNAREREDGEIRDDDDENGLLALFGKPGRETIKLWCQLTEHDFNEDFREPEAEDLLAAVQRSLLFRTGPLEGRVPPDGTLRFREAADPRTELEAVRAEIAEALRADPGLRPEELAIIPADPDVALPLLRAVFAGDDRAPGNVPVLFPDGGNAGEGPLLAGFRALLALGTGEFTRDAALSLLENPAALRAANLDAARLPAVAALFEDAGLARGWDEDADGASSAVAMLARAAASLALDGDDPLLATCPDLPQPVPGFSGRLERGEAGALLDWLDSLRAHLRPLRDGTARSFAEWARMLRELHDAFLSPDAGDARDALDLRRFFDEMETWGSWDAPGSGVADATLVAMLFSDRFRGAEGPGRTAFLRGGVRTGNLAALRGIPFRRVWITGLTSAFPATGDAMPFDLRTFRRLPGESDPASRDLYALLEVLASCTEFLSLSWAKRGADGRERPPSRALTGMMAWLESDVLPANEPFDFEEMNPPGLPPPSGIGAAPVAFAEEPTQTPVRKLGDVVLFLRNPVLHATNKMFRADDGGALEDLEPELSKDLLIDARTGNALLDACLRSELRNPGSGAPTFERLWTERRRGGRTPPSPWDSVGKERLRAGLEERLHEELASLRAVLEATGLRFAGSLRLGPQGAERPDPPVLNLPAFDVAPLGTDLRLGGVLPWFFRGPDGWALLVDPDRDMTAYLVQLCATALSPLPAPLAENFAGTGRLLVRSKHGGGVTERPLPEQDAATARGLLGDLLPDFARALRGEGHLDDVPLGEIEAILKDEEGNPEAVPDWAEAIRERRARLEEAGRERLGRSERRRRAVDAPIPDDVGEIVRRRVLPYLRWKETFTTQVAGAGRDEDAG